MTLREQGAIQNTGRCPICQMLIAENEATVTLPPQYNEIAKHIYHLYCWLRKYKEEGE